MTVLLIEGIRKYAADAADLDAVDNASCWAIDADDAVAVLLAIEVGKTATDVADFDDADKASCWAIDATNSAPRKFVVLELSVPDVASFCSAAPISDAK